MKLLAFDTSSVSCSVALQFGDEVRVRHEEQPREHTRLLLPMIRSVMDEAGLVYSGLDAIVLGNGPGSFIGVRIAASVAQGIAYAAGVDVVPVSSMEAVALQVSRHYEADEVIVTQDAHMGEVYLGIYRACAGSLVEPVIDERLHGQSVVAELESNATGKRVAAGFGWQRYPELLAANEGCVDELAETWHPDAGFLLPLAVRALGRGKAIAPENVVPAYLRQTVAQKPSDTPP